MRMLLQVLGGLIGMSVGICGCEPRRLRLPITAGEAAAYGSGAALVAYLGQPDASAAMCDLHGSGPHLLALSDDMPSALLDGLREGKVPPTVWRRCVNLLVKRLPVDQSASLFDAMAVAYREMLTDSHLETDPALVERLSTLHRLYLDRKPGLDAHPAVLHPLLDELRSALAKKRLTPTATHFGQELLETIDLAHGTWQGRAVDTREMDLLAAAGNVLTLTRFAERLPSEDLRNQARARIVRVHVALSPFPEVLNAGASLEATMLKDGHNAVSLAEHPVLRAWFDPQKTAKRTVVVRQKVWQRTAILLGSSAGRAEISVLPELPLRGTLVAELKDISRPIGLCNKSTDLDPSPCIDMSEVSLGNSLADVDKAGAVHLKENVAMTEVIPLASEDAFSIPVRIAGKLAASLQWGLRFERPEELTFRGATPAGRGASLAVYVTESSPGRVRLDASAQGGSYTAVVEKVDLAGYRVSSRGGQGAAGADGSTGSTGTDGGECSNGGDGGRGGDGDNGGRGGDGGEVLAQVACAGPASCTDLLLQLRGVILSEGGPGGVGGSGGSGGRAGSGGSGRSATSHVDSNGNTVTDDSGCSPGSNGSEGPRGSDGAVGPEGRPGPVRFQVVVTGTP